ncbi:hypothetical protein CONPUDRAFT_154903 [Coniophora puteana RWD-64-598 SS2]|uniref:Uncharacterized protein n=1 Tax=Coniophora puteana (strain RWD-64-598) TaxID=741705 RepID=A0A5M3MKA5_CONPW|nr:uncharacterized protein CONPUDRAFT_154903 [Coniophora puteana RWD-64-598 SS2]EIW79503.1 hypothetical protein CONPUDRAFT_154903 [Coniophora puteana RWD-64-598 SS2]
MSAPEVDVLSSRLVCPDCSQWITLDEWSTDEDRFKTWHEHRSQCQQAYSTQARIEEPREDLGPRTYHEEHRIAFFQDEEYVDEFRPHRRLEVVRLLTHEDSSNEFPSDESLELAGTPS